jgi:hypothetical protein
MASLQHLVGNEYRELNGIRETKITTIFSVSDIFHGLYLLWIVFYSLFPIFSSIPHSILFFYTPLLIHFPLTFPATTVSDSLLFHPTATNSLQTKQALSPIVSVPHACKDGPQDDKKGVCRPTDFHIRSSLSFPHAPPPLSCFLVVLLVLYCMPYLN